MIDHDRLSPAATQSIISTAELPAKLHAFIGRWEPDTEPEEGDYDDMQGAEANGGDMTAWDMCQELRAILEGNPA